MAETPAGSLSLTILAWRRHIASSATIQTLFGAADAAAAMLKVYELEVIQETEFEHGRPFAIADIRAQTTERIGVGEWSSNGELILAVELDVPTAMQIDWEVDTKATVQSKFKDQQVWGLNQAGLIRDEIRANSGLEDASGNSYISLISLELESGPGRAEEDEPKNFIGFVLVGGWG